MNKNFATAKCISKCFSLLVLCLLPFLLFAQQMQVTGTVISSQGNPLRDASITVRDGNANTRTDENGRFSLSVARGQDVIISYVGFTTQQVTIKNNLSVNIALMPSANSLNEVVVTGFTTQKRAEVTSAISTISGVDILKAPVSNITN